MTNVQALEDVRLPAEAAGGGRLWQRRSARWAIIFAVWTVLAFFFAGQLYYTRLLSERPMTWRDAASQQFIYPYLWAAGTILVLWLADRFPVEGARWLRSLLLHLLFATLFVFFISGSFQVIYYFLFIHSPAKHYEPWTTLQWIIYNSSENYGIYGMIVLLNQVSRYYRRFREGELRAARLQTQLTRAQLEALKMQLHPHFLFNTLHSISALVHRDPESADRMIARLGDFLRLTLENSGAAEVSLQKELEFLTCYLEIERVRFNDRLTTSLEVEPGALDIPVPNLILQPIVENALRHGIAQSSAPGRVEISAKRENGSLRIRVQDNGPGLAGVTRPHMGLKEGVGLSNTRARLEQLYGASHRFELSNAPGGGLLVTLVIPAARAATATS
ncbi:MAG: two-component system, LytTR family, sensor kinase [Acidobacteriota bacterium]|jgi:sensor histidine kinase YesM|nr:two-component system, LytTR family, sensor kinase [Acidobacteriota bacterium]MDT7808936.1 two-component system, LytTR family, sensor kinase [Acidobacteriota bacterium]